MNTTTTPDSFKVIPPSALYVHPSSNGRIGYSSTSFPVISPNEQPNIRVVSFVSHPKQAPHNPPSYSPSGKYSYNFVILKLSKDINVPAATLYHGKNKFLVTTAMVMGWDKESIRIQTSPYFLFISLLFSTGTLQHNHSVKPAFCGRTLQKHIILWRVFTLQQKPKQQ